MARLTWKESGARRGRGGAGGGARGGRARGGGEAEAGARGFAGDPGCERGSHSEHRGAASREADEAESNWDGGAPCWPSSGRPPLTGFYTRFRTSIRPNPHAFTVLFTVLFLPFPLLSSLFTIISSLISLLSVFYTLFSKESF